MGAIRRDSFLSLLLQQYCEVWSGGGLLAPWKEGPEPLKEVGQALTSVSWTTSATTCSTAGTTWNCLLQTTSERKMRGFKAAFSRAFGYLCLKHHSTLWPSFFLFWVSPFSQRHYHILSPPLLKTSLTCHCCPYTVGIVTRIKARSAGFTALRQKSNTSRINNVLHFRLSPQIQNSYWEKLIYSPKEF